LGTQAIVTLPEAPALLVDNDRLQGGDHLGIARHAIDARLVVRRPRQPGNLASSNDRQIVFRSHDPDHLTLG
jgi:hypothetical protein